MPRHAARPSQLPLFVSDPAASPEALARDEAIRPVLKGERSLRQQSQRTGMSSWRLWRDLRRFQRDGLLGLIDRRTLPHARGTPAVQELLPRPIQQHMSVWPLPIRSPLANWRGLFGRAIAIPSITAGFSGCSSSITSPQRSCSAITTGPRRSPRPRGRLQSSSACPSSRRRRPSGWNTLWDRNTC
jgi:hypothetical protein